MEIVLVGLNHRTAPLEVRERVSFTLEQARRAADELRSRGLLEESLVLSTCNRSELYGVPPETSHECAPGLSSFLSEFHSVRQDVLNGMLYQHYDRAAVLLGAGTISEQVVSTLRDRGSAHLFVMNRSGDRAESLAQQFGGRVLEWGDWETALLAPDVVVSSVASEEPIVSRKVLEQAMAPRSNRALFLMDLGVPRNVETASTDLYNLYIYNIDY